MKLTKMSSYAAIALVYLATRREEGPTQARQVAEHLGIPVDSALKILQAMSRQQVIRSRLGRNGGYVLHRDPQTLTLLEVIEAMDGPIEAELPFSDCPEQLSVATSQLQATCRDAAHQTRLALGQCTIADMANPTCADDRPTCFALAV